MALEVLPTDKFFYDSPQGGEPTCLCSRCGRLIVESNEPIIRAWPTEPGDFGYDENSKGGTEFRYCQACCEGMGMTFSDSFSEDNDLEEESIFDPEPLEGLSYPQFSRRRCRVCGCTDDNCKQCIEKTGSPCYWVEQDLCSACVNK